MKKTFVIAVALLVAVAFVVPAIAQDQPKPGAGPGGAGAPGAVPKGPAPKAGASYGGADQAAPGTASVPKADIPGKNTKKFAGEVTKVDGTTVAVKGKKSEMTFDVSKAKFKGYKDAGEIKAGDKVGVAYVKQGDKMVVDTFAKAPAKKPAPPKGPADQPPPGAGPAGAPGSGAPAAPAKK